MASVIGSIKLCNAIPSAVKTGYPVLEVLISKEGVEVRDVGNDPG
ncbi:hypothetical protein KHM19_04490 [Leptospira borgpetersenii]|nr:hypothetical protein KHM09_05200 [Leptospira borgpetersenii]GIM21266.1 hypothetical protein KHM19_04490 [Leptospira borgpetersenii]GIM24523.1 hypothetical protein KHM25_04480 [Leptospira borgpetersenii]